MRKDSLINGQYYHIFNKSIAGYTIFNDGSDFLRFLNLIQFYIKNFPELSYSHFLKLSIEDQSIFLDRHNQKDNLVEIIAYCLMPTHFHLILQQLIDGGITKFVSNISNSYSHYFNLKHNRQGPLWQGRFKNVIVNNDEQLHHLIRYVHLNPSTANLVDNPLNWVFSSYNEYLGKTKNNVCNYKVLDIKPGVYERFVLSQKDYQRSLSIIKKLIFD